MAAPAVSITAAIEQGDHGGLQVYADALRTPGDWLPAVGEILIEDLEQRFQTESDPWDQPWTTHSAVTIALRAARGQSGRILQNTRNLANSKFWRVEGNAVLLGLSASYARVHQYGNPNNKLYDKARAPIPARPMLPLRGGSLDLPERLLTEIRETVIDAIRRWVQQHRSAA